MGLILVRRFSAVAVLASAALTLAGCSGSSGTTPTKTVTVTATKTPKLSAADQRKACVTAWAALLHDNADADQEADAPADCDPVPESDQYGAYWDGMMQRNKENRDAARKCLDDPSCTALPVP